MERLPVVRVLFLIRDLNLAGAQRQLVELVKSLDHERFHVTVAAFYGGPLGCELAGVEGVQVIDLHKRGRWDIPFFLYRLVSTVRHQRPHVLHGYMDVANVLCLLVGKAAGARVVWGLRASNMDLSGTVSVARWIFHLGGVLSHFADLIIVNSFAGRQHHAASGYRQDRMVVIPNGIDTDRFRPHPGAGHALRREWSVSDETALIGIIGRLDPQKDYPTFLEAAALMCAAEENVRFVCVGTGPSAYASELESLCRRRHIDARVVWAGAGHDMSAVYDAIDIVTSASRYGEGFSNVLGEALACGTPCVATDVGDSAMLVDREYVVPPGDARALAEAWARLLRLPAKEKVQMTCGGRQRIEREFGVRVLVEKTSAALLSLVEAPRG